MPTLKPYQILLVDSIRIASPEVNGAKTKITCLNGNQAQYGQLEVNDPNPVALVPLLVAAENAKKTNLNEQCVLLPKEDRTTIQAIEIRTRMRLYSTNPRPTELRIRNF